MIKQTAQVVLTDMDDTLHEAEEHIMLETWNKLLAPWNIVWKRTDHTPEDARYVTEEERPGVGIRPLEVIKHFIRVYSLDPRKADQDKLRELGLDYQDIQAICGRWDELNMEEQIAELGLVLEKGRVKVPEQIVAEMGVKEIEGAIAMIHRIRDAGYRVGVVTSGSGKYAFMVLQKLGLLRYENGKLVGDVDLIVHGEIVRKPKPDPEAHDLAQFIMNDNLNAEWIQEGEPPQDVEVVAMFGDSGSDARLAKNSDIPRVFIRENEHLSPQKMDDLRTEIGDRLIFVKDWNTFDVGQIEGNNPGSIEAASRSTIEG